MEGLPLHPGPTGLAILVVGLLIGALYAARIRHSVRSAVETSSSVAWIVLLLVATGLGVTPFVIWRIAEDVRYTSHIDPWLAPRYGVSKFSVHPEMFDGAAQHIPRGDTYFLAASPQLTRTSRAAFRQWALGYLLPRMAVADPAQADWILAYGVNPADVGPEISRVWVVRQAAADLPPAYLGRVGR